MKTSHRRSPELLDAGTDRERLVYPDGSILYTAGLRQLQVELDEIAGKLAR